MQHLFENTKTGRTVRMLPRKGKTMLQLGKDWIDRGPVGIPTTIEEERLKEKKNSAKEDEKVTREVTKELDQEEEVIAAQPEEKSLSDMTVRELNEFAELNGLEVPGGLKKAELIQYLEERT